ncbi:MAG: restriction endonuclease subunit S [Euryarchaeota archaeon]|nr:restriction endonuclease subunit S [Euryarchaeota archaeon]
MTEVKIGFKQTESAEIPEKWEMARLGDVVEELKNGFASGKRDENGIVQIRMNNVTTDGRLIFNSYLKVPVPENLNYWLLKKGDLLFNNTNSIDLVGKSTIFNDTPFPCTFSNYFTRIRFKKELVLPELILYHFLILWGKNYFKSVAIRHVGQSAVHTEYLLKLQIPLPPLPEQRRIAEVLGTVDSAIQKVGGAIEGTERLKKGLMQRLLTRGIGHERFKESEVGRIPDEWEIVQVGDITDEHKQGFYTSENYSEEGINLVRITDLQNPEISYLKMPKIKIDDELFKQFKVDVGDFLIARSGAIGRYGIVKSSIPCVFASYIIRFRFDSCRVDNLYFGKLFESFYISNELKKITQGATNKNINAYNIKKIKIPLPPLPEQRRIAEILSAADRKLELERRRKEKLERVKKGLMNELLTGKKRIKVEAI